ncbi:TrbA-like protein [Acinetobacter junii CIP 107470 = MTCC 11364]|uniref:TrbA-like protein n=1 Tax=Acinetobacter junii CIP 107470 = MTCC 11364 TaxID=1217666 RepID=S7Y6R5_ACIJU|nr:hypothetical protein [Acinetobacter junii]ENV52078.1 hypothetical protein F953_00490 [Acinetobacter junii CIP 107470 = MTCC 11364]EPR86854.1 TrbA-like protein [Acinetobacter junii CIP 107470 = MTCC 11364]
MAEPKKDDMAMTNLILIGILVAFCVFLWYFYHTDITYYGLKFAWTILGIFDWSFSPGIISFWRSQIAQLASQPQNLKFEQLLEVLNKVGYFFIWIPIILAIRGIKLAIEKNKKLPKRKITVETLPWIMAKHSPAIIPSLYYGDSKSLLLNVNPPEHKGALNPEEWVEQHGVLINNELDRERCIDIFIKDLGTPIQSIQDLNEVEKVLFSIFAPRIFGKEKNFKESQQLLDSLNYSCHQGTFNEKKGYPTLALAQSQFNKYASEPQLAKWLEKHKYSRTFLHAIHKQAIQTGKLPSSQFRWLKGMDRGLWYALNTTGRKTPFIESAAVFTQTLWEEYASDMGYELAEPQVDEVVDGIEAYLRKVGILN